MSNLDNCGTHGVYLPPAYYISPSDFSAKSPFLSSRLPPAKCLPYASALPGQVAPGGEGGSNKWAYRSAYSPAYYEEVFHSGISCNRWRHPPRTFHSAVGRNGVLSAGLPQFYAPRPTEAEKESNKDLKPRGIPRSRKATAVTALLSFFLTISSTPQRSRKKRCPYTKYQIRVLEREFFSTVHQQREKTPVVQNVEPHRRQVKIWFQNRRMKEKKLNRDRMQYFTGNPYFERRSWESGEEGPSSPFIIQPDIMSTKIQRFNKTSTRAKEAIIIIHKTTTVYTANEITMLGFYQKITSGTVPKHLGCVMYQSDYAIMRASRPSKVVFAADQW
uniref:Homeobox D11 n=1 Tax=Laticauda laticaudata TaxID=8630 RepID=A0A8C5SIL2_LATLA